jgi:hypothetical protein
MSLTQAEADLLLKLPKHAKPGAVLELTTSMPMDEDWELFVSRQTRRIHPNN